MHVGPLKILNNVTVHVPITVNIKNKRKRCPCCMLRLLHYLQTVAKYILVFYNYFVLVIKKLCKYEANYNSRM